MTTAEVRRGLEVTLKNYGGRIVPVGGVGAGCTGAVLLWTLISQGVLQWKGPIGRFPPPKDMLEPFKRLGRGNLSDAQILDRIETFVAENDAGYMRQAWKTASDLLLALAA